MATSTSPASPRSARRTSGSSSARSSRTPATTARCRFPTAAKSTDLRPYTKGTLLREDEELEEDLEDDVEDEEITDLESVLPPEDTTDEAFEEESDEADENN